MSRTLISRTNKEFDQCSELLRTLLHVQENKESREDSKSPTSTRQVNRQKQSTASVRAKKQSSKSNGIQSSLIKTNPTNDHRALYSPTKSSHSTIEDSLFTKTRLNATKLRKTFAQSPSPKKLNHLSRHKSSPTRLSKSIPTEPDGLTHSSSCLHLSSSKSTLMSNEPCPNFLSEQLTRIRNLSKQIQLRSSSKAPECSPLWKELDRTLSSTLSYVKNDMPLELSLTPLKNELNELRKQLQSTNFHLNEYDLKRHQTDQYVQLQKQLETNQLQYKQLLSHHEQLKTKCYLLKDKLEYFERNNIRLIQRLTKQDLHSITKRTDWISTENRHLLREEILFLKERLYHVYDDISILFNRNQILEKSHEEQKQQIQFYKDQFKNFQETAGDILTDLDQRIVEEKVRTFLHQLLYEQNPTDLPKNSARLNQMKPSAFTFETSNHRPKSLFVAPNLLSNSPNHRNSISLRLKNSSSTIDDADSTMTSSSTSIQPVLGTRAYPPKAKYRSEQSFPPNESGQELDQISDLTSKMFTSGDEEERHFSTSSSSSFPSDAEDLHQM